MQKRRFRNTPFYVNLWRDTAQFDQRGVRGLAMALSVATLRVPAVSAASIRQVLPHTSTSRRMSCSATKSVSKGQEQFVEDRSKFQALQGVEAWLVSEQRKVDVGTLWNDDDVMVLVAARSMG